MISMYRRKYRRTSDSLITNGQHELSSPTKILFGVVFKVADGFDEVERN